MKILHVREIANVAATLVQGLQKLGHEAELRPMRVRRAEGALDIAGVPARFLEAAEISRYIRRSRFDIVHIHWAYMGWMGIAGRYPYLLHCHGFDLTRNLGWPFLGWLTRRAVAKAQRVFYSTPDLAPYAARLRGDAAFIPNPVNLERFRPSKGPGGGRVLLISRFEPKKGPETALAIVRELKRREPAAQVDAFDWGTARPQPADAALLNLMHRVTYEQMPELLAGYDAVIGQFRLGILSMSELEAMACGKPVLSFFDYPQVYDEPPPVFSTRDALEGAETLSDLLRDEGMRREAGERSRDWVERHHDHMEVARLLERHYREVIAV